MSELSDYKRMVEAPYNAARDAKLANCHERIATLQATVERQAAEIARLRDVFESTAWTIQNQPVAKALYNAVTACSLGPSDDDGMLGLYDLIPDEWCVPDRSTVTDDIAENIAFAALDAWLTAARKALEDTNG